MPGSKAQSKSRSRSRKDTKQELKKPVALVEQRTPVRKSRGRKQKPSSERSESEKSHVSSKQVSKSPSSEVEVQKQKKQKPAKSTKREQVKDVDTYMAVMGEAIKNALKGSQEKRLGQQGLTKQPYSLLDDIIIIQEVAQDSANLGLGPAFWNHIIKKMNLTRSAESMRDRYKRFLRLMTKSDLDNVVKHIRSKGTKGFLIFEKDPVKHQNKFVRVGHEDPNTSRNQIVHAKAVQKKLESDQKQQKNVHSKSKSPLQVQTQLKSHPQHDALFMDFLARQGPNFKQKKQNKCICKLTAVKPVIQANRATLAQTIGARMDFQSEFQQVRNQLRNMQHHPISIRSDPSTNSRIVERKQHSQVTELSHMLDSLESMFGRNKEQIISELESVSGDVKDLMEYLEKNDENIKWHEDEDQILHNATSKDDPRFKLLLRYKGENRVRARIAFTKTNLPFAF